MPTFKEDLHLGHSVPTIDTEDIEDGAITEKKMADGSVSTRTIQNGAVTEPKIANRAVTEPKLADWAVSTRTVRDKAISERKLADLSVSTRTIQDKSVTNSKIADSTISMGKLDNDVQTKIQQGTQRAWTPKGTFELGEKYDFNDLVYSEEDNSSYISLQANNEGHVPGAEGEEAWWMKVVDGSYVNVMVEELEQAIAQAIEDAQQDIDDAIADANAAAQAAWGVAYQAVDPSMDETSTNPVQNKVVTEKFKEINDNFEFIDFTSEAINGKRLFNSGGIGNVLGEVNAHNSWKYVKKAVSAGDVIKITGYATGGDALLWTVVDSNDVIIATEISIQVERTDYIIVIPDNAAYIVINHYSTHEMKWSIAHPDSYAEKYEQEIALLEEEIKRNTPNEVVIKGAIEVQQIKENLLRVNSGLESGVEYLFSLTFDKQLTLPVEVRLYSTTSYQSSYYAIQRLPSGKSYYEFNYMPHGNYTNQYIGVYNNNTFSLNINVKVYKKGNNAEDIEELRTSVSAYGEPVVGKTIQIPANRRKGTQWNSSDNKVTARTTNSGTTSLDPIDVTNYDKVLIKYCVDAQYTATTAFADNEDNIIGGRMSQLNDQADYIMYDVPEGATKLYVTSNHRINEIGVRVILNKKNLSKNVEDIVNNSMVSAMSDVFVDYRFDTATGSYFTVVRIHKLKIDGTYQYPHIFAPFGVQPRQWSTLEMNRQFGFVVAINAGLFDVTSGSPTIDCPRGTLVVNGVVLQQQEEEDTGRKYRFLTIDGNGDLGWQPQSVTGAEMVSQGIVDAIAGWEPIIEDYAAIETYCEPGTSFQRQIIGQFGNGDYAIVTSEGRNNMVSDGWTTEEAQAVCIGLGLKFAYRLDGGGSTETVVGKKQINTIYEGSAGRAVPTYIVFNGKTTI